VAIESYPIRIRFLESYTSKDLRIGNKLQFELYEALNSNHKLPRLSKGYIEILCVNKSEFFVQKARVSLGNGRFAGLENINHEVKMFNLDSKEKINITDFRVTNWWGCFCSWQKSKKRDCGNRRQQNI